MEEWVTSSKKSETFLSWCHLMPSHGGLPASAVLAFQRPSTRTLEGHHQIILADLKMAVRPAVISGLETITLTERQEA